MIKSKAASILLFSLLATQVSHADVVVKSTNGNALVYSEEKKGDHYNGAAWGKIIFLSNNNRIDLSDDSRYYISDDSPKTSPSGNYFIVNSVAGGNVTIENGAEKYTDRAYCSIIDMRTGCIVSDLDGWVCSYSWVNSKDILAESEAKEADTFDYLSVRPSINKIKKSFSLINIKEAENILRCDSPKIENINSYHKLLKENPITKKLITKEILNYLSRLPSSHIAKNKEYLFSEPNSNSKLKAYLISGDEVKVISTSTNNQWINIGYINKNGSPLIAWIEASDLQKIK